MPQPRYLMAATLLVLLTLAPMANWPVGHLAAHAQTVHERSHPNGETRSAGDFDLHTVASSNENEREDREERRERNQNDQDDNDDGDDWSPPPPPDRGPVYEPPPQPPDKSAQCLGNGGTVTFSLPGGTATFKSYQDNLYAELSPVDPGSVPSPGNLVGQLVFRLTASPCGGQAYNALPGEANLGVSYTDDAAAGRDESKLTLMFFDGQRWSASPKQANDPPHNYVSSTISTPGTYALVQQ
jgi:hypothetical protein